MTTTESKTVEDNIRNFIEVALLRCDCCGDLGNLTINDGDIKVVNKPIKYGIKTITDWELQVAKLEKWIFNHRKEVLRALPKMKDLDPELVSMVLSIIHDNVIGSPEFKRMNSKNNKFTRIVMTTFACINPECDEEADDGEEHYHVFHEG